MIAAIVVSDFILIYFIYVIIVEIWHALKEMMEVLY